MKILMVLSNPFLVDPRVQKEAKALVDEGHDVGVVVWDRRGCYSKVEEVNGVQIRRIHNTFLMKILWNDLFRNPLWWRQAYKIGLRLFREGFDFDVVHCHDLDTLKVGVWLKKKLDCKLVYDAHELWGYLIEGDVPDFVVKKAFSMEKEMIDNVDHIITVSEPFYDYFKSLSSSSVTLVRNCKDLMYDSYRPAGNDTFTLLYIGGMKKKRFFPEIIDIVGSLDNIRLILAGKKEDLYFEMKRYSKRYDNVEFLGTVPSKEILPLTFSSDVTFIIVDPSSKHYQKTLFNKQFEAMVCGRPIIVTKGTFAGDMTERLECGLTVEYNRDSVRKAIITLRDNKELSEKLGRNALEAAKTRYNWEREKQNLLNVYRGLI